ncbi:MAG TPA: hypothetical protein VFF07_05950 [Actinomycetota bacterium]|nr:hypothetical protein [Actinomycetota bacterium]
MMTKAPLQNRVAPTGEIASNPGRGLLMGNRGCLHGADRRLRVARWRSKHWICCAISWKDVRRDPMPPGGWTALFFLDEATALAAGHRPCAYCRRADFISFAEGWRRAHRLVERPRAALIDAQLHTERVDSRTRRQLTRPELVGKLPDGVMVRYRGAPGLLLDECILPWSFDGYRAPIAVPAATSVELLTPPASVATIAGGYRPLLHPSATGAGSLGRLEAAQQPAPPPEH